MEESKYIRVDIVEKDAEGYPICKVNFGGKLTDHDIIDLMTNMVIGISVREMKVRQSAVIDLMGAMIRDWERKNGIASNVE